MQELLQSINEILPELHGWCSPEKAKAFAEIITTHKPDLCVEIGVFGGSSLISQALALKHNQKGVIYGIDPWENDAALEEMVEPANREWWKELNLEQVYRHCATSIELFDLSDYCKLIKNKSELVVDQFEDNTIDVLHIDGNHSEELSYKDATLYLPKVKMGGHIFFDDIWWTEGQKVTTRKAVVHLLDVCNRVKLIDDCLVLKKVK